MVDTRLPPGQYIPRGWPVLHYGPVPKFAPPKWDFRVFGATEEERTLSWTDFEALPRVEVHADFHCVTKFSVLDNDWTGVSTATAARSGATVARGDARHGLGRVRLRREHEAG